MLLYSYKITLKGGISLKDKELLKLLLSNGWTVDRQKGSHCCLKKNGKLEVIPLHGKDLPIGLQNAILKRTGLK